MRADKRFLPLFLLIGAALAAGWRLAHEPPRPSAFAPPTVSAADTGIAPPAPIMPDSAFVSLESGPHRHAPSLVELPDGRLLAFWFSGSREGAEDVVIRSATLDPQRGRWSAERTVIDRERTGAGLRRYVKKLGNPVAACDAAGRVHLFYVTVSLGGWAGSSITHLMSDDGGEHWGKPQRLITSPFLNLSTLVKGAPLRYADGSVGLPVYHELLGKFGEILRLDLSGDTARLLDKQRLSHGRQTLQPSVLVRDARRALVLMRRAGAAPNRVIGVASEDGGRHWQAPRALPMANPSAAVSGLALPGGILLAALNDLDSDRDALSLLVSRDGGEHWQTLEQLEDQRSWRGRPLDPASYRQAIDKANRRDDSGTPEQADFAGAASRQMCRGQAGCAFEFSYPYLLLSRRGDIHLVYTWNRSHIRYRLFTREALAGKLAALGAASGRDETEKSHARSR